MADAITDHRETVLVAFQQDCPPPTAIDVHDRSEALRATIQDGHLRPVQSEKLTERSRMTALDARHAARAMATRTDPMPRVADLKVAAATDVPGLAPSSASGRAPLVVDLVQGPVSLSASAAVLAEAINTTVRGVDGAVNGTGASPTPGGCNRDECIRTVLPLTFADIVREDPTTSPEDEARGPCLPVEG